MLMKDDERKQVAMIISGKGRPDKMMSENMDDNKIAMLSAAQEVLDAIKVDDKEMLVESLTALIDMRSEYKDEMYEKEM